MRLAFHIVKQIAFCLLLLPVFWCPAHAAGNGNAKRPPHQAPGSVNGAPLRTAPAQTPQAVSPSPAGSVQHGETEQTPEEAHAYGNWVKMEPGGRQAYVGIHGGTAPLTLVCSTDGMLFAFTGQTGSDFTQVLRGGNASRTSANGTHKSGQNASGAVANTGETADGPHAAPESALHIATEGPSVVAGSRAAEHRDAGKAVPPQSPESASRLHSSATVAIADATPVSQAGMGAATDAKAGASARVEGSETGSLAVQTALPSPERHVSHAGTAASEGRRKEPGLTAVASASIEDASKEKPSSPSNSADLVFASGALASTIKDAPDDYLPFGLTPPAGMVEDGRMNGGSSVPAGRSPAFKPLKLRSYQQVLKYSGSV